MVSEAVLQQIKNSKNIGIFLNDFNDIDQVVSAISLYLLIKSEGKSIEIISPEKEDTKYYSLFADYNIKVSNSIQSKTYVVSIDYSEYPIEKVTYEPDEKTGKLNFYIVPKNGEFDFDSVQYKKEGQGFDLLIFLGMKSPKDLGDLYLNNKEIFESNKIVAFSRSTNFPADNLVELSKNHTYSEIVFQAIKGYVKKEEFDPEIASLLLLGILDKSGFLEGYITSSIQKLVGELTSLGGDLNKALKKIYFSKDDANVLLQLKVGEKIKYDFKNGISYSVLEFQDLESAGIDNEENIDVKGRLVNNIGKSIDLAVVAYEVAKDKLWLNIQADGEKYFADKIAEVFDGKGNSQCATCIMTNTSVEDFIKVFYSILKDLYGIEVPVMKDQKLQKDKVLVEKVERK